MSADLSLEALKLLALLRSLLKLQYFFLLESTGGLVSSGESAGTAVFLRGESGGVMGGEDREERGEMEAEKGNNVEVEYDNGERGLEEQELDIESNLSLLVCSCLAHSSERGGRVTLLSFLTITPSNIALPSHTAVYG